MSNLVVVLNVVILCGLMVSAILAVHFEKLLSAVIALTATGLFAAAEFLLLLNGRASAYACAVQWRAAASGGLEQFPRKCVVDEHPMVRQSDRRQNVYDRDKRQQCRHLQRPMVNIPLFLTEWRRAFCL